jgi:hypothetical protein
MAMSPTKPSSQRSFAALRKLVRPRAQAERCELCSTALAPEHAHLVEPASRKVPRGIKSLPGFQMSDACWESLHIPINLAFFFHCSPAKKVVALYPSPAGPIESLLTLEAWHDLEADNLTLRGLEPDVEALLVNRLGQAQEYYRAPMDECYKLVGLIRSKWRGLSGGTEVWEEIGQFFSGLKERSSPWQGTSDA